MKPWSTIWQRCLTSRSTKPVSPDLHPDVPAFRIDGALRPDATGSTFTATGALDDEGVLEGAALPVGQGQSAWIGHRRLRGRKGLLFLLVDVHFMARGATVAQGTFEIVDGTEAYAGLKGGGTYRATSGQKGELVETFQGLLKDGP